MLKIGQGLGLIFFGLILGFSLSAGEKMDWLSRHYPQLVLKQGAGLVKIKLEGWERVGKVQSKLGEAEHYLARLEKAPAGLRLEAYELKDSPALILKLGLKNGLADASLGDANRLCFGLEINPPQNLDKILSFKISAFAPPVYELVPTNGPVLFYNRDFQTVIISPLDHFLYSLIRPEGKRIQLGLEAELVSLPENFSHPIIFYFGKGISRSFEGWGDLLLRWYGNQRPGLYADIGLSYLGYWTDNGAYYYYKTEKGMNYEQTLLEVKKYADQLGVPFGYFQIDSWWYLKSTDKRTGFAPLDWVKNLMGGGVIRWEARPDVFPKGVKGFQEKLSLPLIAHNRWYDKNTEYKKEYKFVDGLGNRNPSFPLEERFWEMIIRSARERGIVVYEQDWLDTQWKIIPYLRQHLEVGENWLDWMSKYARKYGLTIQYCMANPGFFLQAVKYPNITQVRTSGDYLAGAPKEYWWKPFFTSSMLAWACGIYPWKDTYLSSPGQRVIRDEKYNFEETLISILSAGLVGPGDKIGYINKPLLMKTCRKDGLLLKPDKPALPIDLMFLAHRTLYTVITESRTGLGTYYYLAGFNLDFLKYHKRELSFSELGIPDQGYLIYDWKNKSFAREKGKLVYPKRLARYRVAYYLLVPELDRGKAFLGEVEKFIPLSRARFKKLTYQGGELEIHLLGVEKELITLGVKAPSPKLVRAKGIKLKAQKREKELVLFQLQFSEPEAFLKLKL